MPSGRRDVKPQAFSHESALEATCHPLVLILLSCLTREIRNLQQAWPERAAIKIKDREQMMSVALKPLLVLRLYIDSDAPGGIVAALKTVVEKIKSSGAIRRLEVNPHQGIKEYYEVFLEPLSRTALPEAFSQVMESMGKGWNARPCEVGKCSVWKRVGAAPSGLRWAKLEYLSSPARLATIPDDRAGTFSAIGALPRAGNGD
jgi:hypothetical protein